MQFLWAFLVGGFLCVIAQLLIDKTNMNPARILVTYVVAGVLFTALGIYEPLVEFAQCGATIPLSGFGFSLAKGVEKAVEKYGLLGALTGGMTATAGGITTALLFGYLVALFSHGKPKS